MARRAICAGNTRDILTRSSSLRGARKFIYLPLGCGCPRCCPACWFALGAQVSGRLNPSLKMVLFQYLGVTGCDLRPAFARLRPGDTEGLPILLTCHSTIFRVEWRA